MVFEAISLLSLNTPHSFSSMLKKKQESFDSELLKETTIDLSVKISYKLLTATVTCFV